MPDLVKPIGQHVSHEATKELNRRQGFLPLAFRSKSNGVGVNGKEATVGDPDAMGVTPQIGEHVLTCVERGLCVRMPVDTGDALQQSTERLRIPKFAEAFERATVVGSSQFLQHLRSEDDSHGGNGEEKPLRVRVPFALIEGETTAGHDRVHVRMEA